MSKVDGLGVVLDFLKNLQPKIAAQLAKKVLSLGVDPFPADMKALQGHAGLLRVDSGEYRIIYQHIKQTDTVEILLIGKRNDDEVYKQLRR
jgi:mRNA interferase RelE/StbE